MNYKIKIFAIFTFSIHVFAFACANVETSKTSNNSKTNSAAADDKQTYKSTGVIKAIDRENGKITIDHDDIPGYMSAMEMNEAVSDKKLLETVKVGDRVEFEIERTGAKIVVTKLDKIGEVSMIDGGEIYQVNCARCHGASGEGAEKGIPLISGHALHHSADEYVEQVENGEGVKMPAFKDKLSHEEIAAVVEFVREDLQKDARAGETTNDVRHEHH